MKGRKWRHIEKWLTAILLIINRSNVAVNVNKLVGPISMYN